MIKKNFQKSKQNSVHPGIPNVEPEHQNKFLPFKCKACNVALKPIKFKSIYILKSLKIEFKVTNKSRILLISK